MRANRQSEGKATKPGRLPNGKFQKGQSGNPGGVPKATLAIKKALQSRADEVVEELLKLVRDKDPRVRLAACVEVLDRVLGRPTVGEPDDGGGQKVMVLVQYVNDWFSAQGET